VIHFITSLSHGSEQELNLDDFITVCAVNVLFVYLVQCSVFPAEKRPVQAPRRSAPLIHLSISWRANNIYSDKLFVGRFVLFASLLGFPHFLLFGRLCKTVCPMLSDRCLPVCLSYLSVTSVHCGQKVGLIKIKLGMEVGLGLSHIVLDGDPTPPPKKVGTAPPPVLAHALWPNGCVDQDAMR